jgi:hypothetical protein
MSQYLGMLHFFVNPSQQHSLQQQQRNPKQNRADSLRLLYMYYYLLQGRLAHATLRGRVFAADTSLLSGFAKFKQEERNFRSMNTDVTAVLRTTGGSRLTSHPEVEI